MVSKLGICNLALAHLGQAPITSITQEDERARRLNLFYEPIRDEVLRAHNWGFAGAEKPLSLLSQTDRAGEFLYAYPVEALFIRRVFEVNTPQKSLSFRTFFDENTQMRVLQIPSACACAQYTRRMTDETLFDALFVKVFSLALASDLAVTLTADTQLGNQLLQKYQLALEQARRCNMAENSPAASQDDVFTEAR